MSFKAEAVVHSSKHSCFVLLRRDTVRHDADMCPCRDINEGTYSPAASMYTDPTKQKEGATVTFNFGESCQ